MGSVWAGPRLVAVAVLVAAASVFLSVAASGRSELHVLIENWLRGKEMGLVRLHVEVPSVDADYCVVEVFRFPSMLNPTDDGSPEVLAVKRTGPGSTVTVEHVVENMPPVAYKVARDGRRVVAYREPQEYLVAVKCVRVKDRYASVVYVDSRTVEVRPRSPVVDVSVRLGGSPAPGGLEAPAGRTGGAEALVGGEGGSTAPVCVFHGDECLAETRLAVVNSVPGLEVYFRSFVAPRQSAMYLSAYRQDCIMWDMLDCSCLEWGRWLEAGKKLAPTATGATVGPVTGGERGVVVGDVMYGLFYWPGDSDGFAGVCYDGPSYTIYPEMIMDLLRVDPAGSYAQPGSPPWYAAGPLAGDREIGFQPARDEGGSVTGVSTSVSFCYELGCVSLNINIYRAGRSDNEYTTPVLVVHDVSGEQGGWYYWWYRGNDPMSYEVLFYDGRGQR